MVGSKRRQVNLRLDATNEARLARLVITMRNALGIPDLSQADVVMAALVELEKRYPTGGVELPPGWDERPRGRPRKPKGETGGG